MNPEEKIGSIEEMVTEVAVASLEGLRECTINGTFDTPEYELYKNTLRTALTYFESKTKGEQ